MIGTRKEMIEFLRDMYYVDVPARLPNESHRFVLITTMTVPDCNNITYTDADPLYSQYYSLSGSGCPMCS